MNEKAEFLQLLFLRRKNVRNTTKIRLQVLQIRILLGNIF